MGRSKEAQLKPCCILFAQVAGLDRITDEEEYADSLKTVMKTMDEAVELYAGHVDKHEGKVMMATFGVPRTHEDDPERAVRAALLMNKRIGEAGAGQVKIGISLGRVYAGTIGSEIKSEDTVIGEAVNIAARIMEKCGPGEIMVSEELYRITRPVFEFSEAFEFTPHGSASPVTVRRAVAIRSGLIKRRGIEGLQSPMVGRTAEMRTLTGLLNDLFEGRGNRVCLLGEAGVGKTRLIEELFTHSLGLSLERARNINWCTGRCSPYHETLYFPFIEIIKDICGITAEDSEKSLITKLLKAIENLTGDKADEVFPYVANLFAIKLDPHHETRIKHLDPEKIRLQTHIAIALMLRNYSSKDPTVYCIDDLYLADSPTLDMLKFIVETMPDLSALLIMVSRPDKEKAFMHMLDELTVREPILTVRLERLAVKDTREISQNLLRIPRVSEGLIKNVVEKSEGNPFYLEELIKLLIAQGTIYREGQEWFGRGTGDKVEIPYTIEGIIRARFDAMSRDVQGILCEMAVIGRTFSRIILKKITTYWENIAELIGELCGNGYIYPLNDEELSFSHALVREVVYSTLSARRLKELHLKVGGAIEQLYPHRLTEFYELLFEHYSKTDRVDKAVDYGMKAGDLAKKRFANLEAVAHYLTVLQFLGGGAGAADQKVNILSKLGSIYALTGHSDDALLMFGKAFELSADPARRSGIYCQIADTHQRVSNYQAALEYYDRAEQELIGRPEAEKIDIRIGVAWINYLQGGFERARQILEKAAAGDSDASTNEFRQALARIYNILGSVYSHLGSAEKSFTSYHKALKLYELLDDMAGQAVIFNNICGYYSDQGDFPKSLEYLERSYAIDRKTGNLLAQAISNYNIGDTYLHLGELDRAEQHYREYMAINARINNKLGDGYANYGLGHLALERGEFETSRRHFASAAGIFTALKSRSLEMSARLGTASTYRLEGDYDAALDIAAGVRDDSRSIGESSVTLSACLEMARTRIRMAVSQPKMMIYHIQEAAQLLDAASGLLKEIDVGKEELFLVRFCASMIAYYRGDAAATMGNHREARQILDGIMGHLTDKGRAIFKKRRLISEFEDYEKTINA